MDSADANETSSLSSFVQEFETFAEEVKDGVPEVDFHGRLHNRERSRSEEIGTSLTTSSQLSLRSDKQVSFIKALLSPRTPYEEFHRLFKNVPKDQFPINDFSCALSREILLQGRIYISQGWFCFYSNIFGWETQVTIDCSKVQSITREKTAYVVPNAILITTDDDKHFFSSFLSRDTVFKLLVEVWEEDVRKAKSKVAPLKGDESLEKESSLNDKLKLALYDGLEEGVECTGSISELTPEGSGEAGSKCSGDSGIFDCQSSAINKEDAGVSDGIILADKVFRPFDAVPKDRTDVSSSTQPACDPASIAVLVASLAEMLYSYLQVSIRLIRRLSREQLFFLVTTFLIMFLMSCSAFLLYRLSILEPKVLTPPPPPSKAYLQKSIQQIIQLRKQVHEAEVTRVRSIVSANLDAITQIRETLEMLQDDLTNHMTRNCTILANNRTVCLRV